MNTHPYLRAFLAGIFLPTLLLPVMLIGFIVTRLWLQMPFPIERGLVFPLALVPALWGLWNMLWLATHERTRLPLGLHGALLPLLLMPGGAIMASCLGILQLHSAGVTWFHAIDVPYALIAPVFAAVLVGYYLLWKYLVGWLNRLLAIA
ncbi:MAG: hypothetical protein WCE75_10280 [Terracidiphilus sp.]